MLSNALKFRGKDRKSVITIASSINEDRTLLSFTDNGSDIRQEDQAKVCMIFKRLNRQVAGRGIGMYLLKRIVDLNNGTIDIESQENVVTTFHVQFPIQR